MTFRDQKLTIRNVSNKDVRVFGRLTIKKKTTVEVFSKLGSVSAEDIFREFSTSGDLYREVNVKGSLQIISHNLSFAPPSTTQSASATNTLTLQASDGGLVNTDYDYDFIARILGNPNYQAPSSTTTIYVKITGSDTTGTGSSSAPFATIQKAVDEIPITAEPGSYFVIQVGAGTFTAPDLSNIPINVLVEIIGCRDNPLIEEDGGSVTFSFVSNKYAQIEGTVSSSTNDISDASHWMLRDLSSFAGYTYYAYVCLNSSGTNLVINSGRTSISGQDFKVYPYETKIQFPHDGFRLQGRSRPGSSAAGIGISFIGMEFDRGSSASNDIFQYLNLEGCKVSDTGNATPLIVIDCFWSSAVTNNRSIYFIATGDEYEGCRIRGGLFTGPVIVDGSILAIWSSVFRSGTTTQLRIGSSLVSNIVVLLSSFTGGGMDFEGSVKCIDTNGGYFHQRGNISISNTPPTFLSNRSNAMGLRGWTCESGTIDGVVTGNAITIINGCQAVGIKAAAHGNLTSSGGSEIVVGGNAGANFSTLPATDAGAGSPQFCRAT